MPFGKQGQFVPLGVISYQSTSYHYPSTPGQNNTTSRSTISLAPGLEYFVVDSLFLGGRFGYQSSSASADSGAHSDSSNFYVGPLAGYNIPINERFSIRLSAGAFKHSGTSSQTSSTGTQGAENKASWYSVLGEAMILLHPATHMYLGFGPSYEREFSTTTSQAGGAEADGINFSFLTFSTLIGTWF